MSTVAILAERVLRRLGVAIVPVAERPALSVVVPVADIATAALVWLGVIAADETPAASDMALAQAKVRAIHDGLIAQGIVSWTVDAVPQAVSEDMVLLTALHLAASFGKQGDPAQEPVREARIRKVAMLLDAPDLAAEKVMAVHANLDARGKTRWSSQSIPDYLDHTYVEMAAFLAAPEFGVPPDPAAWAQGEATINRLISLPTSGETTVGTFF